MRHFFFSGI